MHASFKTTSSESVPAYSCANKPLTKDQVCLVLRVVLKKEKKKKKRFHFSLSQVCFLEQTLTLWMAPVKPVVMSESLGMSLSLLKPPM